MKKITVLAIAFIMCTALFLTGCSTGTNDRERELEDNLSETYEGLLNTFTETGSTFSMVEEYINSWAKTNGIKVAAMEDHYMVLTNAATEGAKKCDSVAIHCSVNTSEMSEVNQPLATAMTSLLGGEEHGPISLILTEVTRSGYDGAEAIDSKYLKADHLISLSKGSKTGMTKMGAYEASALLKKDLVHEATSYSKAYEITMTVSDYNDAFDYGHKPPNPITVIGNYLASCQSSGKLFQLASFTSKESDCHTAYSASAVVVIDSNNIESMKNKFQKSFESAKKKCEKLEVNLVYTMNETSMPDEVLSAEDKSSIISLIYTIDPGVYFQDEESGEIISSDEITYANVKGHSFKLKMKLRSKTKESLEELNMSLKTTAGLCDFNYDYKDGEMTWSSDEKTAKFFTTVLNIDESKSVVRTLTTSDLNTFTDKNPDLKSMIYTINDGAEDVAMLNLIHYMSYLNGDYELASDETE